MATLRPNVTLPLLPETKQHKRNMMMSRRSNIPAMISVYGIIFELPVFIGFEDLWMSYSGRLQ